MTDRKRWHVVCDWDTYTHEDGTPYDWRSGQRPAPDARVWTLSLDPRRTGWTNDSDCNGYGLTYDEAKELADAANAAFLSESQ